MLLNCAFRWQGVEPVHEHDPRPDALLEAIFLAASAPAHGASAGWPCLHHTAADILCDTLGVLTCLCPSVLQLPCRSARALLAPGAPQLPLDPLLGARHWSQEALRETATDGGLLALLPPAAAAAPAYADLGELVTGGAARHCALLVPWDTSTRQLQAPALSGLLTAGFTAVAVLPPRLVPTTVLEPLGPPLLSHSSPDSQCPHVLLLSWEAPPGCAAAALAALGALARVRAGGTAYLPRASAPVPLPADPPPAQRAQTAATPSAAPSPATASGTLPSGVGTPRPTTAQPPRAPSDPWHPCCCPIVAPQATRDRGDLTWLWRLSIADLDRVQVVGNSNFVSEVVRHADALSALRPEEYLFPHLLDPLPTHVSAPIPRSPEYIGAALDDDAQPDRAASCAWLQETTLATLAAGITPLALHSVIAPWLQRRAQSARGARQLCALAPPPQARPASASAAPLMPSAVNPKAPQTRDSPLQQSPVPPRTHPPQASRAARTPQTREGEPQRPRGDPAVALTTTALTSAAALWAQRTALNCQQFVARGLDSPQQRTRAARWPQQQAEPPSARPQAAGASTAAPASHNRAPASPAPRAVPLEPADAGPAPPLPPGLPPADPRVRHPGRDPD